MSRKVHASYTAEQVKVAFHVFEGNCPKGYVKPETLITALCTYGAEKLSKDQAVDLVRQLDVDENGLINYNDYVNTMMNS